MLMLDARVVLTRPNFKMTLPLYIGVMLMMGTPQVGQNNLRAESVALRNEAIWETIRTVAEGHTYLCKGVPLSVSGS